MFLGKTFSHKFQNTRNRFLFPDSSTSFDFGQIELIMSVTFSSRHNIDAAVNINAVVFVVSTYRCMCYGNVN